jgi:dihydropyrimidinase
VAAFAETCPQYLYLSLDDLSRPGFEGAKFVCSPPLRPKDHQDDLWKGLAGGALQVVATDHAPFNYQGQKDMGKDNFANIPNGLPSVEDRVTLVFQRVRAGRLSPNRWVELIATNPAKMFGLYPRKGTIAPGFDADIVVFDPNRERILSSESHHMNVDYSCYEGMKVWGLPEVVMQRGKILVQDGQWFGKEGQGNFVPRSRFEEP